MKKILITLALMFSLTAYAQTAKPAGKIVTKDMLQQVNDVTSGYKPIVGDSVYVIPKGTTTIVVLRYYSTNALDDEDPTRTDMQAVFLRTKSGTKLVALTFSPVDVTKYIDLLVE